MRYKATFATGFGAGYVLGARAGRARYEQIMRQMRSFKDKPEVQETAGVMQAQAGDLLGSAKRLVEEKVVHRGGEQTVSPYPVADTPATGSGTPVTSMTGANSPSSSATTPPSPTGTVRPATGGGDTVATSGPTGSQVTVTDDLAATSPPL